VPTPQKKKLEKWLNEKHDGLYKSMNTYFSSKALMNSLSTLKWTDTVSQLLGDIVDFGHSKLDNNAIILNMHHFLVSILKCKCIIPEDDMKLMYLAGLKYMVPLADAEGEAGVEFLVDRVHKERIEAVCTAMDKSIVYKAKAKAKSKATAKAKPKPQPKPKSSKSKASKGKAAFVAELTMPEETLLNSVRGHEIKDDEEQDVDLGSDCDANSEAVERSSFWLEDLFLAVDSVYSGLRAKMAEPPRHTQDKVKEICYTLALGFAWSGSTQLNGQTMTKWSEVRDALKDIAFKSHATIGALSDPTSDDVTDALMQPLHKIKTGSVAATSVAEANPLVDLVAKLEDSVPFADEVKLFLNHNSMGMPAKLHPTCRNLVPALWPGLTSITGMLYVVSLIIIRTLIS
jgi:hypothetical protein